MVDLGMAFVDNWVVGKQKGCYWLSNDIVWLVGSSSLGLCLCWGWDFQLVKAMQEMDFVGEAFVV